MVKGSDVKIKFGDNALDKRIIELAKDLAKKAGENGLSLTDLLRRIVNFINKDDSLSCFKMGKENFDNRAITRKIWAISREKTGGSYDLFLFYRKEKGAWKPWVLHLEFYKGKIANDIDCLLAQHMLELRNGKKISSVQDGGTKSSEKQMDVLTMAQEIQYLIDDIGVKIDRDYLKRVFIALEAALFNVEE